MQHPHGPGEYASEDLHAEHADTESWLVKTQRGVMDMADSARKNMIRMVGGATIVASSLMGGEEAQAQKPLAIAAVNTSGRESPEKIEAPVIKQLQPHLFVVKQSETEPNGEGMRGPSVVPPTNYALRPITISTHIKAEATEGAAFNQNFLLNLPRDIAEVARLGSTVTVRCKGLKDSTSDVKLVTSQPNNNRFLSCNVQGIPTGEAISIEMETMSWMSVPVVPMEGMALLRSQGRNKLASELLTRAGILNQGVRSKIKYNADKRSLNPSEINGEGDCGSIAVLVEQADPDFKTVIGYSEACIAQNGGGHAFNISEKGNARVDGPFDTFGASRGEYVVTAVGTDYNFEIGSGWESLSGKDKSYNGCRAIGSGGTPTNAEIKLSAPGVGEDGQMLAEMLKAKKPDSIIKAHNDHVKARKATNSAQNLRKVLAAK